ncbi:MAG: SseB family protein [Nocardioides sp.]|nr:SseB family protein [Nocardioides sp.]
MQEKHGPGSTDPGRRIPDPGFAGDDGAADPGLAAALASYAASPGDPDRHVDVFRALRSSRLLVPVVAVLGEAEVDDAGLAREKTSDMATVLLTGRDGRQALLAFTGLESLTAWRPDARPVPVTAADAARSAVQEGAAALLLDVAGPTSYAVEGDLLDGLARGWVLTSTDEGLAWVDPA